MAQFLFIQDILFDYFGPMYISAVLKNNGHKCDLLVMSEEKDLFGSIRSINPDAILISSMTGPHKKYIELVREIKLRFKIPVVFGGPHATFFPEVLKEAGINYICVGEGEGFIIDFADSLDSRSSPKSIPNLGYKDRGKLKFNPLRNLVQDLDGLPFADRALYYERYKQLGKFPTKRFFGTRGCPYNCSFCYNHSYKLMYANKGIYVRRRSADNLIREIMEVHIKYPIKTVRFPDDSFTLNKKWLLDFLKLYKQKVPLPFTCLARGNELDEEVVSALKDANCINVFFGIESGSEKTRNLVLNKALRNQDIIKAAKTLHKYKLNFGTYNMIGLPGETLKDAFKTIEFNAKIKAILPSSTILQPYPKTSISAFSQNRGYLNSNFSADNFDTMSSGSVLNMKTANQLVNLNSFFTLAVWYPWLIPLIKQLIKLPPNPLYRTMSFVSMGIARLKAQNLTPIQGVKLALRFLGNI